LGEREGIGASKHNCAGQLFIDARLESRTKASKQGAEWKEEQLVTCLPVFVPQIAPLPKKISLASTLLGTVSGSDAAFGALLKGMS
jgi:hypothetical protein